MLVTPPALFRARSVLAVAVPRLVPLAPRRHRDQYRPQALAMARQRIFHARWHLCEYLSIHHLVARELTQMFREHLLGGARYQPLQFAEAMRPALEIVKNQRLPFSADHFGGELYRATIIRHSSLA